MSTGCNLNMDLQCCYKGPFMIPFFESRSHTNLALALLSQYHVYNIMVVVENYNYPTRILQTCGKLDFSI